MNRHWRPRLGLDRFSGLYLWALIIIVFSIWIPSLFPTSLTVHLIASTQAIAGIIAIAVLIPMVTGQFDLSVGATANLAGLVAIVVQTSDGVGVLPASLLAIVVGATVGFLNGFIVVKLRVSSFIATLGMGSVLAAFQVIVTSNNVPPPVVTPLWNNLTQTTVLGFQLVVVYLIVIAAVAWWLLERTPAGRYMHATGGNVEAARLSGIRVNRWAWISLTISGSISGLAGLLYVSLTGPSLSFGPTLLLPAFAAVFLGLTQLRPGRYNVWGTLLAIFVLATGVQGLQLVSGVQWLADMFNGVALIAAVALAARRGTLRLRVRKASPEPEPSDPVAEPAVPVPQLDAWDSGDLAEGTTPGDGR